MVYRDRDIDRSWPPALNRPEEDGGVDLAHVVLAALRIGGIVITIIGFVHLHKRAEMHQGVAAATFLALRRLDEFVRTSGASSSERS